MNKASGPGLASRAMVVQARTLELYDQVGLPDEVVAQGIVVDVGHVREGGREIATLAFRDLGQGLSPNPFPLCYAQDDRERFLGGKLARLGCAIEWNTELDEFAEMNGRIRATLSKGGARETAEYLAGCDGARSRTRHRVRRRLSHPSGRRLGIGGARRRFARRLRAASRFASGLVRALAVRDVHRPAKKSELADFRGVSDARGAWKRLGGKRLDQFEGRGARGAHRHDLLTLRDERIVVIHRHALGVRWGGGHG